MLWNIYFSRKYATGPWNTWQLVWVAEVLTVAQILLKMLRVLFLIEIKVSEPCHPENFTILVLPTVPRACNFQVKEGTFTWSVSRCFSFKKCLRAKMPTSRGTEFLPALAISLSAYSCTHMRRSSPVRDACCIPSVLAMCPSAYLDYSRWFYLFFLSPYSSPFLAISPFISALIRCTRSRCTLLMIRLWVPFLGEDSFRFLDIIRCSLM